MGLLLEGILLGLLLAYFLTFIGLALVKGKKYLKSYSKGQDNKDYLIQSQNFSLALSGLSITALALFVSLKFEALASFSPIILFFSISFVTLALSWNLLRFPKGFYQFVSEVLRDIGVLSIGCGFFVFFWSNLSFSYIELPLTFFLFIVAFLYISYLDFIRYRKLFAL